MVYSAVPDYYQCQLDHHGKRLDYNERPELSCGSMEFMATTAYCKVMLTGYCSVLCHLSGMESVVSMLCVRVSRSSYQCPSLLLVELQWKHILLTTQ